MMGPILFLVYISDLLLSNPRTFSRLLKFVDDSKVMTRVTEDEDVARL